MTERNPSPRAGRPARSRADAATDLIRDKILDLTIAPGSRIDDRWLAQAFGLGRTPVREAVNRLAAEGLVDLHANRGAFVLALDLDAIEQLFEAYAVAERLAAFYCDLTDPALADDVARMQAAHRECVKERRFLEVSYWNAAFRIRIAETARNRHIEDWCRRMQNQMRRLGCLVYRIEARDPAFPGKQLVLLHRLHDAALQAIRRADRDALIAACDEQVRVFRERVGRALTQPRREELPLSSAGWR